MQGLTTKIIFNRKNKLNKHGEASVEMRLQYDNETCFLATGVYLKAENWQAGKIVSLEESTAADFKGIISGLENRANTFYRSRLAAKEPISVHAIKKHLQDSDTDTDDFLAYCWNIWDGLRRSTSYKESHALLFKYLKEYEKKQGGKISFFQINYSFLAGFQKWMLRHENYLKTKKLSQNYVSLLLTILKTYTNEALKEGLLKSDPFISLKIKTEKSDIEWLTLEQIQKIEPIEITRRGFAKQAKDAYLFSCYGGGQRFSDLFGSPKDENAGLRVRHIHVEPSGYRVKKEPKKTAGKELFMNLPLWMLPNGAKATEILKRNIEGKKPDEYVFGNQTTNTANDHLRWLLQAAGIEMDCTFHSARHSFAMNSLLAGYSKEQVQMMLVHASITTTEKYARLAGLRVDDILRRR